MIYSTLVDIPKDLGRITFQTQKGITYVILIESRQYDPEKKYTRPKRVSIGKRCTDDPTKMYPNEKYFRYYRGNAISRPDQDIDGVDKIMDRPKVLNIGAFLAIEAIVKEYGLDKMLKDILPNRAGHILDLVAYQIIEESNQGQHFHEYAFENPLFNKGMQMFSDSTISRVLREITPADRLKFLEVWNKSRPSTTKICISYDSTNKNCQAGDIEFAEYGFAKDDKGLPIYNIAIANDTKNKVPLIYEAYPGSVSDVSQLQHFINKAKAFGYTDACIILDRGYFSRANLEYMEQSGFSSLIMSKSNNKICSEIISTASGSFEDRYNTKISGTDSVFGTTLQNKLYPTDSKDRYFHVFFSHHKKASEVLNLHRKLENFEGDLKKFIGTTVELGDEYHKFFDLHYDTVKKGPRKLIHYTLKQDVYQETSRKLGYFCIISSDKMTAEEAYTLYKGRDSSEKLFKADKTFLGGKSGRVHDQDALESKLFIEFIALIVRNRFYNLLRTEAKNRRLKNNYLTVPAALRELKKIKLARVGDSPYELSYAITKTQLTIFSALGISKDQFYEKVGNLATKLQSLINNHDLDYDEFDCEDDDVYTDEFFESRDNLDAEG